MSTGVRECLQLIEAAYLPGLVKGLPLVLVACCPHFYWGQTYIIWSHLTLKGNWFPDRDKHCFQQVNQNGKAQILSVCVSPHTDRQKSEGEEQLTSEFLQSSSEFLLSNQLVETVIN